MSPLFAAAQEIDRPKPQPQEIDSFVESGMEQLKTPATAIAFFENGEITHMNGFGRIDGTDAPVTAQTPFQIGSVSKSFTSLVVLQLADEGRLSIDDPVVKHIPYFQTRDPKVSSGVTIRHLMNHVSGIATLDGNRYQATTYRGEDATELAVRRLRNAQLKATPGELYQYSNANYATLAHLIETIEHKPFEKVIEARIFTPLGMKNSFVQTPDKLVQTPARGHLKIFGHPVEKHFIAGRMMMGAGGITASAEDLATYLLALSENDPRVTPSALAKTWAKKWTSGYEFGWEYNQNGQERIIHHGGLNPGFRAMVMYVPEKGTGGVVLTNQSGSFEGNLPWGSLEYALGLKLNGIKPPKPERDRFKMIVSSTLILALGCILSVYRLYKTRSKPRHRRSIVRWSELLFPTLILGGIAFILYHIVPRLSHVTFPAVGLFYPDLGFLLTIQIATCLVWMVTRFWLLISRPI